MSAEPVWPSLSVPPPITLPQPATDELRIDAFERLLSLFPPGRLIDLGAGHGKLAIRAARLGWNAVAIDARTERFPVTDAVEFRNIDVRDVSLTGYDLILCLGLFYHLTLDDQRSLLARCAGTPLIIDTHMAVGASRMDDMLSDMVEIDGLQGRWFKEGTDTRSSWGNEHAFWPTPESLGTMLRDVGYGVVRISEEQHWHLKHLMQPVSYATLCLMFQWGVGLHDLDARGLGQRGQLLERVLLLHARVVGPLVLVDHRRQDRALDLRRGQVRDAGVTGALRALLDLLLVLVGVVGLLVLRASAQSWLFSGLAWHDAPDPLGPVVCLVRDDCRCKDARCRRAGWTSYTPPRDPRITWVEPVSRSACASWLRRRLTWCSRIARGSSSGGSRRIDS